jgi:hypothetical protein
MGQLSVVWVVPPIVGLVAYVGVRLFWKKDELGIAARRKRSLGVNYAAPKNDCRKLICVSIGSRPHGAPQHC